MNVKLVKAVADAIDRSQKNGKRTPMGIAIDLESRQLVQSPETAAELEKLRSALREATEQIAGLESDLGGATARVAELETALAAKTAPVDEDPFHPCGCPKRFNRHAFGCPTTEESADKLTRLLAPTQALRETDGEHYAAVHHTYRVPRDLPEMGATS